MTIFVENVQHGIPNMNKRIMEIEEFATKYNHPTREEQDIPYNGAITNRKGQGFGDGMASGGGGAGCTGHGYGILNILYTSFYSPFEGMP